MVITRISESPSYPTSNCYQILVITPPFLCACNHLSVHSMVSTWIWFFYLLLAKSLLTGLPVSPFSYQSALCITAENYLYNPN